MATEIEVFEKQLQPLAPSFQQVLGNLMPVERLMRTVVVSVERTPKLLECDRQTLLNGAMTFAVLGLEVDGVTGQGYLLPFNDRRKGRKIAQPIIGYRGFNTLAARANITLTGDVVREGDEFDYDTGEGWVRFKKKLGEESSRRIIAAWAKASASNRPPVVEVLSIDEILAVKNRAPGGDSASSPWNDAAIGFPAMAAKTAKRRLARSLPLSVMSLAAAMEQAFEEQGRPAWINSKRDVVIDGEVLPARDMQTPTAEAILGRPAISGAGTSTPTPAPKAPAPGPLEAGAPRSLDWGEYCIRWQDKCETATDARRLIDDWNNEQDWRRAINPGQDKVNQLKAYVSGRINDLKVKA